MMTDSTSNCVGISRHTHSDGNETVDFDNTQNVADYLNSLLAVQGIEPNPGPTEDKVVVGDKRLISRQDMVLRCCRDREETTTHTPIEEKFRQVFKDKREAENFSINSPNFSNIFDSPVDVEQDNMTGDTIKTRNVPDRYDKNNKKKSKKNPPVKQDGKKGKKNCKYEIANVLADQRVCTEPALPCAGKHIVKLDESENPYVLRSRYLKTGKTRLKMDDDVIVMGKLSVSNSFKKDSQMLEKLIQKINEFSDVKFEPLGHKQDAPMPVEMPKTRSLTVAKFRAQFNRNCTLLPQIGETASLEELGCVIPVEEHAIPEDKNGQKYNKNFLSKMEYIRQKTLRDYIKKLEDTKKRAESLFGIERCHGSHELNTALLSDPYADIKPEYLSLFASNSPKAIKPKHVRLGRRFKRARQSEQVALRKRIEQQALYTPHGPAEIGEKIENVPLNP